MILSHLDLKIMTTTKKTTTSKPKKARTVTVKKPASLDLPRNPFMFEILDLVSRQTNISKTKGFLGKSRLTGFLTVTVLGFLVLVVVFFVAVIIFKSKCDNIIGN